MSSTKDADKPEDKTVIIDPPGHSDEKNDSGSDEEPVDSKIACPVCLDIVNYPVVGKCGHMYCHQCIKNWWVSTKTCECPVCKLILDPDKDLTTVFCGNSNGADTRSKPDFGAEIIAGRAARQAEAAMQRQAQFNVNFGLGGLIFGGPFGFGFGNMGQRINAVPMNGQFNNMNQNGNQAEVELPPEEQRRINRQKALKVFLSILFMLLWIIAQLFLGQTRTIVFEHYHD